MAFIFRGSSVSALTIRNTLATPYSSSTGIDTNFVDEGIAVGSGGLAGVFFTAASEMWFHFNVRPQTPSATANPTGQDWIKISSDYNTPLFAINRDNGTWTSPTGGHHTVVNGAETSVHAGQDAIVRYDIYIKVHASAGVIRLYQNETLVYEYTGNTVFSSRTTINNIRWHGQSDNKNNIWLSEIIISDTDTRGMRLFKKTLTADGANTAWANGYANVAKTSIDDTTNINSSSAGQKESYTGASLPGAASGMEVREVSVAARIRKGTTGPQNAKGLLRIGGTDYTSANMSGIEGGYVQAVAAWTASPATAAKFTQSEVNNLEAGLESAA